MTEDPAKFELLKKQRAAFKGQLTYFKNQASLATTLGSFESLLRRVQLVYDKYNSVQLKLESIDESTASDRDAFEDDYGGLESSLINKIHESKRSDEASVTFHNSSIHEPSSGAAVSTGMRLPELNLPSFNGKESEWLAFRDVFIDLIHTKNIEPTIKFVYLISQIRAGSAYNLIENLPVISENYEIAWKVICDKYNNEIAIQKVHMRELYDIKAPTENSFKALQLFIDNAVKHYNALKSLKVKIDEWNLILTYHLTQKLDTASRIAVIKGSNSTSVMSFAEFISILRTRVQLLQALNFNTSQSTSKPLREPRRTSSTSFRPSSLVSSSVNCEYCAGQHLITHCPSFNSDNLSPKMRFQFIKDNRLCVNCLTENHLVRDCMSPPCSTCSLKHHAMLHFKDYQPSKVSRCANSNMTATPGKDTMIKKYATSGDHDNTANPTTSSTLTSMLNPGALKPFQSSTSQGIIMIGTALVNATTTGTQLILRALLDSGSHMNFITTEACNCLRAKRHPTRQTITGIGGTESIIKHKIILRISSRFSNYNVELEFYVIPKITHDLPAVRLNVEQTSFPSNIQLADPYFYVPDRIDLLLGVEIYNQLFKGDYVIVSKELPPFYNSELGYVVCGKAMNNRSNIKLADRPHAALCSMQTLEKQLKQFWELETVAVKNTYSVEENLCEEHYCKTVRRLADGRYSVALPVKSNIANLGSSHLSARRQFLSLEKRLHSKDELYQQYREFMAEYIDLGHMVPVTNINESQNYYLPHHYVLKDKSTTTKLRVVFNASSKTSSQLSLNDCLMVGPTIQENLFSIVLRFRKHNYAFCGDIAKMYRQIFVHDDQHDLQRIWWRDQPSDPLQIFKLRTVTYGTASAPFLATRTLNQLVIEEHEKFPAASKVAASDFYVDDILTGATTLKEASKLKTELIELLKLGGFELRKFYSNDSSLSSETQSTSPITLVLGLLWNTDSDSFEAQLDKLSISSYCSKRNILSEICQLFDPLGLCAPIIVTAKLFVQLLWFLQEIGWDDHIPDKIATKWIKFKSELLQLQTVVVPRCIFAKDVKRAELHGFGDASERAFGCVFYIRVTDTSDYHQVKLVCAKSRVAPLKKQTIPRLELCAAVLLAELTHRLLNILNISFDAIYLWSDSEITLYRIRSQPHQYTTFVANRVAKIQEYTSASNWYYVKSSSNPADCVSRGLMPSEFGDATLWWNGPEYLRQSEEEWPKSSNHKLSLDLTDLETRTPSISLVAQTNYCDQELFNRFQSVTTLLRVVAYMVRFCNNAKNKTHRESESSIFLRPSEISNALNRLVSLAQLNNFGEDIKSLKMNKLIPTKSSLRCLSPFLDADGMLRVGGRLDNAPISHARKHPLLLPGNHALTKLIVRHEHIRLLHAGPQALLYNLRLRYWIIGGRNLCRTIVNQCIRCFHARPHTKNQIMGNLPTDRVTESMRPFIIVGVDFCGPFSVKQTIRSKLHMKTYVCLFVCFATKAVHLELVMNLSTESFIACLRRFVARRGMCTKIYSDNATNFVGARSELRELSNLFLSQSFRDQTHRYCASNQIEWLTIPPRSPHFGGLWEAAIKSAKHHIKRVAGAASITTEEFYTLISQIEAVLNSRPLTSMSSDPSDLNVLSPGHFLIGSPLTSLVEPSLLDLRIHKLSRFQLIQRQLQMFWNRWKKEYLTELQRRYKWQKGQHRVQVGELVLLHDDQLPPMKWSLGRIIETHPSKDGIVRVVTVKTSQSVLKRATNRISILPINDDS